MMKRKRTWKRCLCALMMVALLAAVPGSALALDPDEVEWKYEDSILINVVVDKSRAFSPEDFLGLDCKKIFVLEKKQIEKGFEYQLVLKLNKRGAAEMEEALEKVQKLPMVIHAERDFENAHPKSTLTLNRSCLYLAVNETADVFVKNAELHGGFMYGYTGVSFTPNPASFNLDQLQKDSFLNYGITRFWPDIPGKGSGILLSGFRPEDLEATKSESGIYYGLTGEDSEYLFDSLAALASSPEFPRVSIVRNPIVGALPGEYEYWDIGNSKIAECSLSGGKQDYTLINQTATIRGLQPGITSLTCMRGKSYPATATSNCTIIVYEPGSKNNPGDINHDGSLNTQDALQVLEYTAKLISLDKDSRQIADLTQDDKVNAIDALLMLQIAAKLL